MRRVGLGRSVGRGLGGALSGLSRWCAADEWARAEEGGAAPWRRRRNCGRVRRVCRKAGFSRGGLRRVVRVGARPGRAGRRHASRRCVARDGRSLAPPLGASWPFAAAPASDWRGRVRGLCACDPPAAQAQAASPVVSGSDDRHGSLGLGDGRIGLRPVVKRTFLSYGSNGILGRV